MKNQAQDIRRRSQKGFTLMELVVVVCTVALLATALMNRVLFYQEQAEKTAMVAVAGAIQSELVMRLGRLIINGEEPKAAMLAVDNPMNWLAKIPENYAGEFSDPLPSSIPPGNWMFDSRSHELIYVLDRTEYFVPGADGQMWIRYRTRLLYEPIPGTPAGTPDALVGTLFEPVEPYRWFE